MRKYLYSKVKNIMSGLERINLILLESRFMEIGAK